MSDDTLQPSEADVQIGLRLLQADTRDTLTFLGLQAERVETARQRAAAGRSMPGWSPEDALEKVLSPQRSTADFARYAGKGLAFARELLGRIESQLRGVLCLGTDLRPVVAELTGDAKELLKYVASSVAGMLIASLPGIATAIATTIAATLAVIVIRNGLTQFCAIGMQAIDAEGLAD